MPGPSPRPLARPVPVLLFLLLALPAAAQIVDLSVSRPDRTTIELRWTPDGKPLQVILRWNGWAALTGPGTPWDVVSAPPWNENLPTGPRQVYYSVIGSECLIADDCFDGNDCTDDSCDTAAGTCSNLPNSAPCSDSDPCTTGDACSGGACAGTGLLDCGDGNPCTRDDCVAGAGCQNTILPGGTPCDDGDLCTTSSVCSFGTCTGATFLDCEDGNPCTSDPCDPASGCGAPVNLPDSTPCTDSNPCTSGEACLGGACSGGNPIPDGAPCDDASVCTPSESCAGGLCVPDAPPLDCSDLSPCTADTCDPATGCSHEVLPDLTPCDDGNACTLPADEVCVAGLCRPGSPADCGDGNPCTADFCNPSSGCGHLDTTLPCDDGDACTTGDVCGGGSCTGLPVICDDGISCTVDACDPATGCTFTPRPDGNPCDDLDACTSSDRCTSGVCGGDPVDCDDGNSCTDDLCENATGCQHAAVPDGAPCNDLDPCTTVDLCDRGACAGTAPLDCEDGNPCTTDSCDPLLGICRNEPRTTGPCDDGDACTTGDSCIPPGVCGGGTPLDCDDRKGCTVDGCQPQSGCTHVPDDTLCPGFPQELCDPADPGADPVSGCVPV